METRDSTLEGVKDKMLDDRIQYEIRNRSLYASMDYKFERERIFYHIRWRKSILLPAKYRRQDDRLTDGKPQGMFLPLKVRAALFKSFESIAIQCRQTDRDILTPTFSDQTIEEFQRLSIQRRQRELDCVAAGQWESVDRHEKWAVDYNNAPKDWIVGISRGDVVVGRLIPPEIFNRIQRISECGPNLSIEIRGVKSTAQKIKGFQKLILETTRNEKLFSEILSELA